MRTVTHRDMSTGILFRRADTQIGKQTDRQTDERIVRRADGHTVRESKKSDRMVKGLADAL